MSDAVDVRNKVELVTTALEIRLHAISGRAVPHELSTAFEEQNARVREAPLDRIDEIAGRFDLTTSETMVISLALAVAINERARRLLAHANNRPGAPLDSELLWQVVYGPTRTSAHVHELSGSGALFRWELMTASGSERMRRKFEIGDRVLRWLLGDTALDPTLEDIVAVDSPFADGIQLSGETITSARQAVGQNRNIIIATGRGGMGRRSLLRMAAREHDISILEIDTRRLANDLDDLTTQLKLLARECRLLRTAPLLRTIDAVDDKEQARIDLIGRKLVSEIDGPVFVTCGVNRPAMRWDRPCIVIDVKPPTTAQRAELWLRELGQGTPEDAEYLAAQYPLAPALIHHAANAAKARAVDRKIEPDDIYAGIRSVLDDRLGHFAKRVDVTQSWDDLVLPQDQQDQITYLVARIRQRGTVYERWGFGAKVGKGLGVSALFSGPPGTGKTMVAALIAKELGIELYQVDMAKLVSKWIGETERNLAELFDAAEAGHAILLFDEADSLFGKRTDVKSSNDRYANLETNYLLQRLESFNGICLLTSNHESAIDPAFMRRLSLHLRFELPDVAEREALWRAMIPAAAPVEPKLDVAGLAKRFAMSGGYIRNAALRAAFMAADEGSVITTAHLERAARFEYEAMGKIAA